MTNRRNFLKALGSVVAWPRFALAQQAGRTYRVGWLSSAGTRAETYNVAFVERLRELGFAEGRNLVVEFRNAEGRIDRVRELAAELGRGNVDVLLATGSEFNLVTLKQASRDTPIVMIAADYDPVATGHIASLARPGGRITGVSPLQSELPAKRLELLKELLPKAKRIAVLADSATAGQLEITQATAKRLGVTLKVHEFKRAPYDYEGAFAEFVQAKADAVLVLASGTFVPARRLIPELALKHRLPSMFNNYLWAEAGGLLTYGVSFPDLFRRAADQVALVLRGAKPGDLPVEQPSTVELVFNLKTAKGLGITIPQSIRVRADRVIE
jgi:putative tryptophan/tyrosine transport system substrate-binding protein